MKLNRTWHVWAARPLPFWRVFAEINWLHWEIRFGLDFTDDEVCVYWHIGPVGGYIVIENPLPDSQYHCDCDGESDTCHDPS